MHVQNRDALLACDPPLRESRRLALDLLEAALDAVDARASTERAIAALRAEGRLAGPVTVLAFGKAARSMAEAALSTLDVAGGIVIAPCPVALAPLRSFVGGHPLPCDDAPNHGRAVLELAAGLPEGSEVLALVSGGGSAMLELPHPGLCLADLAELTRLLLTRGADIVELNAVRAALSQLKGGRLAQAFSHTRLVNVLLSDVIDNSLATIASGPTVAPDARAPQPRDVLAAHGLDALPAAIERALAEPMSAVPRQFEHVHSVIAADNVAAQEAMLALARRRGLVAHRVEAPLRGEARETGPRFLGAARARGGLVIGGGETTVTVRGPGHGGRNHEFALSCLATPFAGTLACLGTDGTDGTSHAAGALADAETARRGAHFGVAEHLARSDSGRFMAKAGAQIVTGPTGTNVADVCVYVPETCIPLP